MMMAHVKTLTKEKEKKIEEAINCGQLEAYSLPKIRFPRSVR